MCIPYTFENKKHKTPIFQEQKEKFERKEKFNTYLDEAFGDFEMKTKETTYSYTASEILFNVDKQAYVNEYNAFIATEE